MMKRDFNFSIESNTNADFPLMRAGIIHTPHGDIKTPNFNVVGTHGQVKFLPPTDLARIGGQVMLSNGYHLFRRATVISASGGLAKWSGWNGPTFTDSGGFQVMSLGSGLGKVISVDLADANDDSKLKEPDERLAQVDEEGVIFRDPYSSRIIKFTPEMSIATQHKIGADVMMSFDELTNISDTYDYNVRALERTRRWAERGLKEHIRQTAMRSGRPYQALYGVLQGSYFLDLRRKAAEDISTMTVDGEGFDGFGLGSRHVNRHGRGDRSKSHRAGYGYRLGRGGESSLSLCSFGEFFDFGVQFGQLFLHLEECLVEHFALFFEEGVILFARCRRANRQFFDVVLRQIALQGGSVDVAVGLEDGDLLGDVLQLAHVTRPTVVEQHVAGIVGQLDYGHAIALGKVGREFAEKQQNIFGPFAQGRDFDVYGAEPVVKVFAEFPFRYGFDHVEVGGGYDAYVGFQHGRRTHFEKFAAFENTQQSGLSRKRQFTYLVEEDGASVGLFEIAFTSRESPCEGSFFVAEKLGVDGAFGYGSAVDGNVFPVFAGTVGMDYLWKELFAGTAFAGDEHGQIDGCYLQSSGDSPYQARGVTDNAEPLFGLLYFCGNHNR